MTVCHKFGNFGNTLLGDENLRLPYASNIYYSPNFRGEKSSFTYKYNEIPIKNELQRSYIFLCNTESSIKLAMMLFAIKM